MSDADGRDVWIGRAAELLRLLRDDHDGCYYPTGKPTLRLRSAINDLIGESTDVGLDDIASAAKMFRSRPVG